MLSRKLKLTVIGGGSSYTPELIEGLIRRHQEFPVADLVLVDIEEGREKLEIVGALARRMVKSAGVPIQIHLTLDRKEALREADFVVTQLRVGLLKARIRDERLALRHNCIGQETTGVGGFAKALRTIPVLLEIAREMEELSPDAFLINFTNPAGVVTEALLKHSNVRAIGLCNLPIGMKMRVAALANVSPDQVELEMVGINHLNWTTKVVVGGVELTQQLLKAQGSMSGSALKNIPDLGWDAEFIRSLQALPCDYHRYYYMADEVLESQKRDLQTYGTRGEAVQAIEAELFNLYRDENLSAKPPQLEQRGGAYYSEAALNLMTSIYNNRRDVQIVNVRNGSTLPCLPPDVTIETRCRIDAQGAHPLSVDSEVTPQVRGLLQVVKAYEELTVKAAVEGDRDAALQALTIHPLVPSARAARALLDDILKENEGYLPQFK